MYIQICIYLCAYYVYMVVMVMMTSCTRKGRTSAKDVFVRRKGGGFSAQAWGDVWPTPPGQSSMRVVGTDMSQQRQLTSVSTPKPSKVWL